MLLLLFLFVFLALILGAPVAVALGGGTMLYVLVSGQIPDLMVIQRMISGIDTFPLLAVPFFILAGNLMNAAQITDRIFDFAKALFGWLHGGLAYVNIGSSILFAGMSGAAVADAGGLGAIEIKAMRDAGYDDRFAVGITAASSTIGPIVPPSLPFVIYGVTASASIGQLFAAGLIPGFLMALCLGIMVFLYARARGYPREEQFLVSRLWTTFRRAFLSLLTPVIIIGGILGGVFTPTEAAVAACAYALILGLIYGTLDAKSLWNVTFETARITSAVMFIVAAAAAFAWVLIINHAPERMADLITGLSDNKIVILLAITLVIFFVGFFLETIAAITILVPVLLPVAVSVGVDPVHFGVIMILNLMIGLLTPPVGMVLYVLSGVAKVPVETVTRGTLPFLVPLVIALLLVTFIPELAMWLPGLLFAE